MRLDLAHRDPGRSRRDRRRKAKSQDPRPAQISDCGEQVGRTSHKLLSIAPCVCQECPSELEQPGTSPRPNDDDLVGRAARGIQSRAISRSTQTRRGCTIGPAPKLLADWSGAAWEMSSSTGSAGPVLGHDRHDPSDASSSARSGIAAPSQSCKIRRSRSVYPKAQEHTALVLRRQVGFLFRQADWGRTSLGGWKESGPGRAKVLDLSPRAHQVSRRNSLLSNFPSTSTPGRYQLDQNDRYQLPKLDSSTSETPCLQLLCTRNAPHNHTTNWPFGSLPSKVTLIHRPGHTVEVVVVVVVVVCMKLPSPPSGPEIRPSGSGSSLRHS